MGLCYTGLRSRSARERTKTVTAKPDRPFRQALVVEHYALASPPLGVGMEYAWIRLRYDLCEGDERLRITSIGEAKVTVKRSRFLARIFPASSLEEALAEVKAAKGRVRKGRHHCWACRISDGAGFFEQAKDDGEVGRPGTVLLQVLTRHELEGGIVVSRIFGGVKLGAGGVSRAFREAAEEAVERMKK